MANKMEYGPKIFRNLLYRSWRQSGAITISGFGPATYIDKLELKCESLLLLKDYHGLYMKICCYWKQMTRKYYPSDYIFSKIGSPLHIYKKTALLSAWL
ncbi:hypothetical protein C5167_002275, partial [Papaver somniferum]